MDYEKDIKINESALDVEWLEHPLRIFNYTRNATQKRLALDKAKEGLDLVHAELDKEIRTTPETFEITKITESVVENTILLQLRYRTAAEALTQAKYEYDVAMNAVKAMDVRSDALANLVKLYAGSYFAGPTMPRDLAWEVTEHNNRANANVIINQPTRKRKE